MPINWDPSYHTPYDDMPDNDDIPFDRTEEPERSIVPGMPTPQELIEMDDEWTWRDCAGRCGKRLSNSPHGYPYAYCEICLETQTCHHSVLLKESCNTCDSDSDFAYDALREKR